MIDESDYKSKRELEQMMSKIYRVIRYKINLNVECRMRVRLHKVHRSMYLYLYLNICIAL